MRKWSGVRNLPTAENVVMRGKRKGERERETGSEFFHFCFDSSMGQKRSFPRTACKTVFFSTVWGERSR